MASSPCAYCGKPLRHPSPTDGEGRDAMACKCCGQAIPGTGRPPRDPHWHWGDDAVCAHCGRTNYLKAQDRP